MKNLSFKVIAIIVVCSIPRILYAQVLHTENFNVVLDSSKAFKGNFSPSFRFRNLKSNFIEVGNTADISVRVSNHAFTVANRIEYSVFGSENLFSGGFLYAEYVNLKSKTIAFEPFAQIHWLEIRGLDRKYAGGANLRWRAIHNPKTGLFIGVGGLYEYEKWGYSGVPESSLPADQSPILIDRFRGSSYINIKHLLGSSLDLDLSVYFQPAILSPFIYRLAGSFEVTYNITKYVGIRILYQNIYDSAPLVPIDKLYHDINSGITVSF